MNIKKILYTLPLLAWALPQVSLAQLTRDLIICNKTIDAVIADSAAGCDFNDLIVVANIFMNLVFELSLAIAILVLLFTGGRYLLAGSSDGKRIAKEAFLNLAKGFAFILGAYLIVNTLFTIAGVEDAFKLLG